METSKKLVVTGLTCLFVITKILAFATNNATNDSRTVCPISAIIECPPAFVGECGDSFHPDNTGWPVIDGNDISPNYLCYHASYSDNILNDCGNGKKITRSWTITNTCGDPLTQCDQIIKLSDDEAPVLQCPADVEVSCDTDPSEYSEGPEVFDECGSSYTVEFDDSPYLPCTGNGYTITRVYTVTDACGNAASCAMSITILCRPTVQAYSIFFPTLNSTSLEVEWYPGNGNRRIVLMNTVNNFSLPPDGYDPLPNTVYDGSGEQVIYNGSGDNVTVTGLQPNTTYWFRVFEASDCSGDNLYITATANGNPKSQKTGNNNDPSAVVPNQILSPLPSITNPGLFQSNLPFVLWNATLPFSCIQAFKCNDNIWNQNPFYPNSSTPGELIPYASSCFTSLQNNWEFRQRGFITGYNGNPCNTLPCSSSNPTLSHSANACWSKDDRYAWDARFPLSSDNEVGICVFAVADGDVSYQGNQAIRITHPKNCVSNCWYSWYDNIDPTPGLTSVSANQHIGHIKSLSGPHLHFGVYYKNITGKLISVNRPLIPNFTNINGNPYTSTNITGTCLGSLVSGATVFIKKEDTWFEAGETDENGRFSFITIPGIQNGDSLMINANGFETLKILVSPSIILNNNNKFPLIENSATNGVVMPYFTVLQNQPVFNEPSVQLKIGGVNFETFDILKINQLDEGVEYMPISMDHSYIDSILTVVLPDTGINHVGVRFEGSDTILLLKDFYYYPDSVNICTVELNMDSTAKGSKFYFDNQFIKSIETESETENVTYICGEHYLTFIRNGYKDAVLILTDETHLDVKLEPILDSLFNEQDSCVFDFTFGDSIIYCKNVSIYDSSQSSILLVKQGFRKFTNWAMKPKSKSIEFNKVNLEQEVSLHCAIAFDETQLFIYDSLFLLVISDSTILSKKYFNVDSKIDFDSESQKLDYMDLSFGEGQYTEEILVVMAKQLPIKLDAPSLVLNYGSAISLPFTDLFSDPDSVKNDMIFIFPQNENITIIQDQDSFLILANKCYVGHLSIPIGAKHDELLKWDTINIEILPRDSPTVTLLGENLICQGDSVGLFVNTNYDIFWNTGDTTDMIFVKDTGNFYALITDSNGCMDTTNVISIDVVPLFHPNIYGNPTGICIGDTLFLNADKYNQYFWSNGSINQFISITEGGEYAVTVVDLNGCAGNSDTVRIENWNLPTVNLGPDTLLTETEFILDAGSNAISFEWNTGDTSQLIVVSTSGEYSVVVTDSNGCQASDTINVDFITSTTYDNDLMGIRVYPNPNQGVFHLEFSLSNPEKLRYEIYDPVGRMAVTDLIESTAGKINTMVSIPNPKSGVYFLRLCFGSNSHIIKLIVL